METLKPFLAFDSCYDFLLPVSGFRHEQLKRILALTQGVQAFNDLTSYWAQIGLGWVK